MSGFPQGQVCQKLQLERCRRYRKQPKAIRDGKGRPAYGSVWGMKSKPFTALLLDLRMVAVARGCDGLWLLAAAQKVQHIEVVDQHVMEDSPGGACQGLPPQPCPECVFLRGEP